MRVAFVVRRLSVYRQLGPLIDRAQARGAQVECWHDYSQPRGDAKGYLFPATDKCPVFRHGQPRVRPYDGAAELARWLTEGRVDAVVSEGTRASDTGGAAVSGGPLWVCAQVGLDTLARFTLPALETCDLVGYHTPWWTEFAAPYYAAVAGTSDVAVVRARLERLGPFIGFPELDARRLIDPAGVRRRWGIPAGQPVVVLLPFPQGVGQGAFWPRKIFTEPSRVRRLLNVAMHRELEYWRKAWSPVVDQAVVAAVRSFCDRNGAFLLVKSREKTPVPEYIRNVADKCLYDETYYPPTILEALSIAQLCVGYYSFGVVEAVASAVPNISVAFDFDDYIGRGRDPFGLRRRFFTRHAQGPFEFPGASSTLSPQEAIADLPLRRLADYRIDPAARRQYLDCFAGPDDACAADRLLSAIEARAATPMFG